MYPTVQRLQQQGKIRFIGVTEYFYRDPGHEMLKAALQDDLWDTLMVKYGILNMSAEREVLPQARAQNVGVINMSAVRVKMTRPEKLAEMIAKWKSQGLLAEDSLPPEAPLDFLIHDDVCSIVDAGYRFGASDEAVSTVLIGTGNLEHLEANVASVLGPPLPEGDVRQLRELFGQIVQSEEP